MHDTVEDTDTSYEELEKEFGPEVAKIVGEVSDDKSLPKMERKELQVTLICKVPCILLYYFCTIID